MSVKPEELLEEIGDDFNTYLKKGILDIGPFSDKIEPNLNIDNLEDLLKIHFILTRKRDQEPGVIDFIQELPQKIRKIKTTITHENRLLEGEVKGRIDWQRTIKTRNSTGCSNETLFVCKQTKKNYEIKENLVLKKLLMVIHEIVFNKLKEPEFTGKESEWLDDWFKDKNDLKNTLERVFHRNIYLRRIKHEKIKVTDRMVYDVKKSRNKLYRDAATLLEKYRKLLNHELNQKEAKNLLRNTFIKPNKPEVLFELYWTIKVIKSFEKDSEITFKWITKGKNIVAEWEDKKHNYKIYHNSTGSKNITYNIKLGKEPKEDGYLKRQIEIVKKWKKLSDDLFDETKGDNLWSGRPDIVLEKYNKEGELLELLIGEVKYTQNKDYALKGLRELLEYMALVQENEEFIEKEGDILKSKKVRGILFTDKLPEIKNEQDTNEIKIVPYKSKQAQELSRIIKKT